MIDDPMTDAGLDALEQHARHVIEHPKTGDRPRRWDCEHLLRVIEECRRLRSALDAAARAAAPPGEPRPDLDEIEARIKAATEGPWDVSWKYGDAKTERYCVLGPKQYADPIATTSRRAQGDADAQFIAHAREDIPALVAEVRAQRGDSQVPRPVIEADAYVDPEDDEFDVLVAPGPNKRTPGVWMPREHYDALVAAGDSQVPQLVAQGRFAVEDESDDEYFDYSVRDTLREKAARLAAYDAESARGETQIGHSE